VLRTIKRAFVPVVFVAVVAAASFMAGCGNSGTEIASTGLPTSTPASHTAASGPAITDKVLFDQLTLESPPKQSRDKNGLVFVRFKYADSDGKVYECVLPQAMSEGQYTLSEWSGTFNAYRLPKVIAQKKVSKRETFGDFPFISPKPQQQPPATPQPDSSAPIPGLQPPPPTAPPANAMPRPGSEPPP